MEKIKEIIENSKIEEKEKLLKVLEKFLIIDNTTIIENIYDKKAKKTLRYALYTVYKSIKTKKLEIDYLIAAISQEAYEKNKEIIDKIMDEIMKIREEKLKIKKEEIEKIIKEKKENIHVVDENIYDWETGRRIYTLSYSDKEIWEKIKHCMYYFDTKKDDLLESEWNAWFKGWAVMEDKIEELEDILNVKPELRLKYRYEQEKKKEVK
jgi:hypothetical protein